MVRFHYAPLVTRQLPTKRFGSGSESGYAALQTFVRFKNGESNGADSPDVKGKANSGDGDSPASHVAQVMSIDHESRRSVTAEVNEGSITLKPEEIDADIDTRESKVELAKRCREKYGHLDNNSVSDAEIEAKYGSDKEVRSDGTNTLVFEPDA